MRARVTAVLARLAGRMSARSRGRCPCPLCSLAERRARARLGMPLRHPERVTRELPGHQEEQLAALAAELWPAGEWTEITTQTWKEGQ